MERHRLMAILLKISIAGKYHAIYLPLYCSKYRNRHCCWY